MLKKKKKKKRRRRGKRRRRKNNIYGYGFGCVVAKNMDIDADLIV